MRESQKPQYNEYADISKFRSRFKELYERIKDYPDDQFQEAVKLFMKKENHNNWEDVKKDGDSL